MSYDKKMKDLLGRLVGMSPEAPPYPDETPLAARHKTRSRPHPGLVFAGAVALVAALAVPVILLTGGQDPVAGDSTTTTTIHEISTSQPETSSTTSEPSSSTTPPTTTPTTVATAWQGTVFLYQTPDNSFLGNPALVPIQVDITDPSTQLSADDPFTAAIAAVRADLPTGLENSIPAGVQILSVRESSDSIVVDMNEAFLDGAGGLLADITMLNQIIYTLTDSDPEKQVEFTVSGQPVKAYGTEGLVLTEPVDRETFIEDIGLIFLTEPIMEVEHVYLVSGMANTFEASLTVRVVDADGATVYEEPVQATCGSGCWGEFGVGVASDLVTRGESSIQLFEYSAEDGSMTNVITIPILENDYWTITLD